MRWWNVNHVSPSGLRLNRAWHLRQFIVSLIPPVCAWVVFEGVRQWEESTSLSRVREKEILTTTMKKEGVDGVNNLKDRKESPIPSLPDLYYSNTWGYIPDGYKKHIMHIQVELYTEYDNWNEKMILYASTIKKYIHWEDTSCTYFEPFLDAVRRALSRTNNNCMRNHSNSISVKEIVNDATDATDASAVTTNATTSTATSSAKARVEVSTDATNTTCVISDKSSSMKKRRNANKASHS